MALRKVTNKNGGKTSPAVSFYDRSAFVYLPEDLDCAAAVVGWSEVALGTLR
jgi:hypothetical protein